MDIPQGSQIVAGVAVHDARHARGAGENAARLDQQDDVAGFRIGHKLRQCGMDSVLIIVLRHDDDPLDTGGGSEVDKVFGGLDLLLARRDVDGGIERGDAQPLVAQRASGCLGVVALKRATLAGEDGVAAYGTIMYVNFIFVSIFFGYAIGSAPIVSYHYGANNQDELKNLFHKSIRLIGTWAVSLFIIAQLIATPLATLFVGYDQGLFELTRSGFRLYSFTFLINGFNIYGSAFFTALNNGLLSALISFLRTLVFQMAVVLLLPLLLGINGVWCSVAIAELLTLCVTGTFIVLKRNTYHYL